MRPFYCSLKMINKHLVLKSTSRIAAKRLDLKRSPPILQVTADCPITRVHRNVKLLKIYFPPAVRRIARAQVFKKCAGGGVGNQSMKNALGWYELNRTALHVIRRTGEYVRTYTILALAAILDGGTFSSKGSTTRTHPQDPRSDLCDN